MHFFDAMMMKNLAFPDVNIEKWEFLPLKKDLKIFIDGAVLDVEDGPQLGRGVLFFSAWENLSIRKFDTPTETWFTMDKLAAEGLRDLCEVKFLESMTYLCGFGRESGQWFEWKFVTAKMHAEFDHTSKQHA